MIRLFFPLMIVLLLLGCAPRALQVQVDAISNPAVTEPGKRYQLKSGIAHVNENDLYFQEFSQIIHRSLQQRGFSPAANPDEAEIIILLSYGVSGGKTERYTYSTPIYDFVGGDTYTIQETTKDNTGKETTTTSRIYVPLTTRVVGRDIREGSYTTYTAHLMLEARDPKADKNAAALWRATAEVTSPNNDLRGLMPVLASALQPYLGANTGRVITLKLEPNDPQVQQLMR
ncbi:MAG: hypothetical protein AB1810_02000 [Pseudomonadota bacterium]